MKAMILAGGLGSRLAEETIVRPKPMAEIGGRPIIWHVMKTYAHYGIQEFIVCLGYKGHLVKEYFANYFVRHSDVTIDLSNNRMIVHESSAEPWKVTLTDTGMETMTGGRVRRASRYLEDDAEFCLTYADGVCDVDIRRLVEFHRRHGKLATMTAIRTPGRFGRVEIEGPVVTSFEEKPAMDRGWINAGYFVLSRGIVDYIEGDSTSWERQPVEQLTREGQLAAFRHEGFWGSLDTPADRQMLENLWGNGAAPWKVW